MKRFFSNASLYKIMDEPMHRSKLVEYLMLDRMSLQKAPPPKLIKDKYPALRDQLTDINAKVPAYHHFESINMLRADLRESKDTHFKKNYSKELLEKKKGLELKYFGDGVDKPDYLAALRARFQAAFVKKRGEEFAQDVDLDEPLNADAYHHAQLDF